MTKTTIGHDEVEDRLRRTFSARAEDVAARTPEATGAGTAPVIPPTRGVADASAVDASAAPPDDGTVTVRLHDPGDHRPEGRRRRKAPLAVAATTVVIAGMAAVAVSVTGTDGDAGTATPATGGLTPSTTATPTTTVPGSPQDGYPVAGFEQGDDTLYVVFDEATGDPARALETRAAEILPGRLDAIEVGTDDAYAAEAHRENGTNQVWLAVEGGIVRVESSLLTTDELAAVAETVTRDPDTGRYTVPTPEGWTRLAPETVPEAVTDPPASSPHVARVTGPDDASYNVLWYPGETTDGALVPDDAESVTLAAGPAYIGSVVPNGPPDMLQLWIPYDDGLIEMQAGGLTRDEVIAAGDGISRTAGSDDFTVTPLPGYTLE